MPYIPNSDRDHVHPGFFAVTTAGQLNYQITCLLDVYMTINGKNYQVMNDIVGALEGAKAEFQRRVVAPYEDQKIIENGDVYSPRWVENTDG